MKKEKKRQLIPLCISRMRVLQGYVVGERKQSTNRITNVLLPKENREAEQSTCQAGFKGVEVGHTPGEMTADRGNFLCAELYMAHLPWL